MGISAGPQPGALTASGQHGHRPFPRPGEVRHAITIQGATHEPFLRRRPVRIAAGPCPSSAVKLEGEPREPVSCCAPRPTRCACGGRRRAINYLRRGPDLGSLGFGGTVGSGINATGQVTGYSYLSTLVPTPECPPVYGNTKKTCVEHPWHAF